MNINPIVPITKVHLLKSVPLDNKYTDTLTFANKTAQYSYFYSKLKTGYSFQNLLPVKLNSNTMQLPICADSIYDCNYLMFQNENFSDRWLYAFITEIEFISINCCNVHFELDVMQTWYFDYTVKPSFVVREHVIDDTIGLHLVPENLETGELTCNSLEVFDFSQQDICILSSLDSELNPAVGETINGIYSGLNVIAGISATATESINGILQLYVNGGKEDSIVSIYQYPHFCGDSTTTNPVSETRLVPSNLTTIDGYTPKNNKLFTSPYNIILMSNNEGKVAEFHYENFMQPFNILFDVVGVYLTTPCIFVYPVNHRGITNDYDSGLTLNNFPQCSWIGDSFKAWISQNKGALAMSTLATASSIAGGVITGNPFAITSGAMGVAGEVGSIYDKTQIPPQVHGQISTESINAGMNRIQFCFQKMSIKNQQAKIIDGYFTKFGYKVNAVKVPNINTRPSFNYVKTIDCNIVGSIPFNDISKIRYIYDNGLTFWHGDYVGDYDRANK
jgi:hypothetical protein